MKTNTIIIIILAIVILVVINLIIDNDEDHLETSIDQDPGIGFEGPTEGTPTDATSQPRPVADDDSNDAVSGGGTYIVYSESAVREAASDGDAVLFFHAAWCPTCRSLDRQLNKELGDIPEELTIFRTDYDTYDDLKQKYGVQYQHTLVLVDENLNSIKKWTGSRDLEDIIDEL